MTVAALFVDPNGVYAGLPDVDVWDEARDARLYAGPWPVVAHPPCNRWCKPLAYVNQARYGQKVGDDGGCFKSALASVRAFGGVLEHPAYSAAWDFHTLPKPSFGGWVQSFDDPGYVAEVDQWAYGHAAAKRTWLYFSGDDPPPLEWRPAPRGLPVVSLLAYKSGRDNRAVLRGYDASGTPVAFRDVLLAMARTASRVAA